MTLDQWDPGKTNQKVCFISLNDHLSVDTFQVANGYLFKQHKGHPN